VSQLQQQYGLTEFGRCRGISVFTWNSMKFRGNTEIPRQRPNSAARLKIPQLAENCGPYSYPFRSQYPTSLTGESCTIRHRRDSLSRPYQLKTLFAIDTPTVTRAAVALQRLEVPVVGTPRNERTNHVARCRLVNCLPTV